MPLYIIHVFDPPASSCYDSLVMIIVVQMKQGHVTKNYETHKGIKCQSLRGNRILLMVYHFLTTFGYDVEYCNIT